MGQGHSHPGNLAEISYRWLLLHRESSCKYASGSTLEKFRFGGQTILALAYQASETEGECSPGQHIRFQVRGGRDRWAMQGSGLHLPSPPGRRAAVATRGAYSYFGLSPVQPSTLRRCCRPTARRPRLRADQQGRRGHLVSEQGGGLGHRALLGAGPLLRQT